MSAQQPKPDTKTIAPPKYDAAYQASLNAALLAAIRLKDIQRVEALLEQNAEVNTWGDNEPGDGDTPLQIAAAVGDIQLVRILLRARADIHAISDYYGQPITIASYDGHLEVVHALLEAKSDPDGGVSKIENPYPPLRRAVGQCHTAIVQLLLAQKVQMELFDEDGCTTLMVAAKEGHSHLDIIKALLGANAMINSVGHAENYGRTPLHHAIYGGSVEVVEELLHARAEVNHQDDYGNTPLHRASREGNVKFVELLLEAKANPLAVNKNGMTAMHWLAQVPDQGDEAPRSLEVLRLLPKVGLNRPDLAGDTALHIACRSGNLKLVGGLLKARADISVRNEQKLTALECISPENRPALTELLARRGSVALLTGLVGQFGRDSVLTQVARKSLFDRQVLRLPLALAGLKTPSPKPKSTSSDSELGSSSSLRPGPSSG